MKLSKLAALAALAFALSGAAANAAPVSGTAQRPDTGSTSQAVYYESEIRCQAIGVCPPVRHRCNSKYEYCGGRYHRRPHYGYGKRFCNPKFENCWRKRYWHDHGYYHGRDHRWWR